jgi:hypothetical protein
LEGQQRQMNLHECLENIQALPKNLQNDINNHLAKWIVNEMWGVENRNSPNYQNRDFELTTLLCVICYKD